MVGKEGKIGVENTVVMMNVKFLLITCISSLVLFIADNVSVCLSILPLVGT